MEITITELEKLTGQTFKTIKKRLADLDPIRRNNVQIFYDSSIALQKLFESKGYNLDQERARLASAQADKAELDFKKLTGEVIDADDLRIELSKRIVGMRAKILGLAKKLTPQVLHLEESHEIENLIEDYCHEALLDLSQDGGMPEYKDLVHDVAQCMIANSPTTIELKVAKQLMKKIKIKFL